MVSVGVEPDLDAVGIVQADEHGAAAVAGDDVPVGLASLVEGGCPGVDVVAGGNQQRDGVEAGQRPGTGGISPQGDLRLAALARDGHTLDLVAFDELDHHVEAEHLFVPGPAASEVTDRQLDVMYAADHSIPRFL